ncbi:MAG: 3-phosphoshikimate 1-carboxyvinyltransferase [Ruminococcaceae bacterium]|nr:3-phosphoshikimate 1-carboxyvinyltransferase [Oscillospiraceae bacterium]
MTVTIKPAKAKGAATAPPSKSMAHRLLICAGMCEGESLIHGVSYSEDVSATIDCLRNFGALVERVGDGRTVRVCGVDMTKAYPKSVLRCRESGSTLRFFLPLALLSGREAVLTGAASLLKRPMIVYKELCDFKDLKYEQKDESITVKGKLPAGRYTVSGNISSQFISGMLFALPFAEGNSYINITPPIESRPYLDLTLSALNSFGLQASWKDDHTLYIPGGQRAVPCECSVEGDFSNSAFLDALNVLGGDVTVEGLSDESLQGDREYKKMFELLKIGAPALHIGDCPDLGPVLFALAAACNGGVFSGTRRLRLKESDRSFAMTEELKKFGVSSTIHEDSVVIYPADFHAPTEPLCGHNDHRIVMSLAVLLTKVGGIITGAEAVNKSYPEFFETLRGLGIEVIESES